MKSSTSGVYVILSTYFISDAKFSWEILYLYLDFIKGTVKKVS